MVANHFLERLEIGIINIGGKGTIRVDGEVFSMD
ncbi:MAG: 5-dehydro-4-deoxy-D-glucuronate isomerase, partial [Gorillibacterium sp.]|nr:5-dehydro-4-deoxy-D-glucuronate isomerase [Gorillibacterium sp.]